jgi:hypothetical protein
MLHNDFIPITITRKDGAKSLRFVNKNHIQQIYEENEIIYIELSGYDTLEVHGVPLTSFIEACFVH